MTSNAIVWTDGSCLDSHGGWAALLCLFYEDSIQKVTLVGHAHPTTNNRMEMQAVIEGIRGALAHGFTKLYVAADSNYVIQTLTKRWHKAWKDPANSRPNWDLWEELIPLFEDNDVEFVKIKGHSKLNGDYYNEHVDKLAAEVRKRGKEQWQSQEQGSIASSGSSQSKTSTP